MAKPTPIFRWLAVLFVALAVLLVVTAAPEALAQAEGADAANAAADGAADTEAGEEKPTKLGIWIEYLGRFHVVTLHLPIGLLVGAFVLELLGMFRRTRGYDVATATTLVLGTLGALVAITLGLFLEEKHGSDYDALTMVWHKWLGIAMGVLALLATILKIAAIRKQWDDGERGPGGFSLLGARLSVIGFAVLLPVVGHLGGNMTHTRGHLVDNAPINIPDRIAYFPHDPPAQASGGTGGDGGPVAGTVEARWISDIQPIMDAHCTQCHGDSKQNADLRLDSLEHALQGSEYGQVIEQGRPELSRMYQVVCLHPDDDYFMPPGKPGLDLAQMRTLALWITDSIDLGKAPPADGTTGGGTQDGGDPTPAGPAYDTVAADRLLSLGTSVAPEAQGSDYVNISFANQRGPIAPEALATLAPLADHIKRLDLSNSGVTDADLGNLPDLPALERLYLKDTAITDAGLADLPEMFSLTYLNLFGTQITDAGLEHLEDIVTLEKVFLSETGVTLEGVQQLREALGDEVEVVFDDTVGLIGAADSAAATNPADEPTVMVNTICPVSGEAPASADHTLEHDGRLIGFCCDNCKAKFAEDPAPYLANLP
ncbi:hypothetical protein OT109_15320 [Phycisphaeraceae bacterium D3-23]